MRNRDAASLIAGISSSRALTKRIKYSVTENLAHRAAYTALGLDPDSIGYGLNDKWLDAVADQLGLPRASELAPDTAPKPSPPVPGPPDTPPAPELPRPQPPTRPAPPTKPKPRPKPRPRAKPQPTAEPEATSFSVNQLTPVELFLGVVFCIAEAFSFGATGKWAYGPDWGDSFALIGFALVGFSNGVLAVYNYCKISDQQRAEWWAIGLATLAGATHLATGFKQFPISFVLVSISLGLALFALASGIKKK